MRLFSICASLLFLPCPIPGQTLTVAKTGGSYSKIQAALDAARPGAIVEVHSGVYSERIRFPRSGTRTKPITLRAASGHRPIVDGSAFGSGYMVLIQNKSHLRVVGLEIRNLTNKTSDSDLAGIRIEGSGTDIQLRDNHIHRIKGRHGMGITVYGTSPTSSIADLIIDGNHIHDCDPMPSEALTLNGNIERFAVTNNHVHDVNNIGIDFIGGENGFPSQVVRDGICSGNTVERARHPKADTPAAGIYVDGGKNILIDRNTVASCNLGIEIGAENKGVVTSGIRVRNNQISFCDDAGIVFGGYDKNRGRVVRCVFRNNTCFQNTVRTNQGELWIQFASENEVYQNIFFGRRNSNLLQNENGSPSLHRNLWFAVGGQARFYWLGTTVTSLPKLQSLAKQGKDGMFGDPMFADATKGDFRLAQASRAVDAAAPGQSWLQLDHGGLPRLQDGNLDGISRVDLGAHEFGHVRFSVTGTPQRGKVMRVVANGTSGMPTLLAISRVTNNGDWTPLQLPTVGTLMFDLRDPWIVVPLGNLPINRAVRVPLLSGPETYTGQLAVFGKVAANTSNPITITFR